MNYEEMLANSYYDTTFEPEEISPLEAKRERLKQATYNKRGRLNPEQANTKSAAELQQMLSDAADAQVYTRDDGTKYQIDYHIDPTTGLSQGQTEKEYTATNGYGGFDTRDLYIDNTLEGNYKLGLARSDNSDPFGQRYADKRAQGSYDGRPGPRGVTPEDGALMDIELPEKMATQFEYDVHSNQGQINSRAAGSTIRDYADHHDEFGSGLSEYTTPEAPMWNIDATQGDKLGKDTYMPKIPVTTETQVAAINAALAETSGGTSSIGNAVSAVGSTAGTAMLQTADMGVEALQWLGNKTGFDVLSSDGEGMWTDENIKKGMDETFGYDRKATQELGENAKAQFTKLYDSGDTSGLAEFALDAVTTPELYGEVVGFMIGLILPGGVAKKGVQAATGTAKAANALVVADKTGKLTKAKALAQVEAKKGTSYKLSLLVAGELGTANYAAQVARDSNEEYKKLYGEDMSPERYAGAFTLGMISGKLDAVMGKAVMTGKDAASKAIQAAIKVAPEAQAKGIIAEVAKVTGLTVAKVAGAIVEEGTTEGIQAGIEKVAAQYKSGEDGKSVGEVLTDRDNVIGIGTEALLGAAGGAQMRGGGLAVEAVKGSKDKIETKLEERKYKGKSEEEVAEMKADKATDNEVEVSLGSHAEAFEELLAQGNVDVSGKVLSKMDTMVNEIADPKTRQAAQRRLKKLEDRHELIIESQYQTAAEGGDVRGSEDSLRSIIRHMHARRANTDYTDEEDTLVLENLQKAAIAEGISQEAINKIVKQEQEISMALTTYTAKLANSGHRSTQEVNADVIQGERGAIKMAYRLSDALASSDSVEAENALVDFGRLSNNQTAKVARLAKGKTTTTDIVSERIVSLANTIGVSEAEVAWELARLNGVITEKPAGIADVELTEQQVALFNDRVEFNYAKEQSSDAVIASNKGKYVVNPKEMTRLAMNKVLGTTIKTSIDKLSKQIELESGVIANLLDAAQSEASEEITTEPKVTETKEEIVLTKEELVAKETAAREESAKANAEKNKVSVALKLASPSLYQNGLEADTATINEYIRVLTEGLNDIPRLVTENYGGDPKLEGTWKLAINKKIDRAKLDLKELPEDYTKGTTPTEDINRMLADGEFEELDTEVIKELRGKQSTDAEAKKLVDTYYAMSSVVTLEELIDAGTETKEVLDKRIKKLDPKKVLTGKWADRIATLGSRQEKATETKEEARVDAKERIAEVQTKLESIKEEDSQYKADMKIVSDGINTTKEVIATLKTDKIAIKKRLAEIDSELDSVNTKYKEAEARLDKAKNTTTSTLKKTLARIIAKLKALMTKFERAFNNLQDERVELLAKLGEISKQLDAEYESKKELMEESKQIATDRGMLKEMATELRSELPNLEYRGWILKDTNNTIPALSLGKVLGPVANARTTLGKMAVANMEEAKVTTKIANEAVKILEDVLVQIGNTAIPTGTPGEFTSPQSDLRKEDPANALVFTSEGKIDANVALAIAVASKNIMATSMDSLAVATPTDVARILGVSKDDITPADVAKYGPYGKGRSYIASQLAGDILSQLGLEVLGTSDVNDGPRLKAALGNIALMYMEGMEYIQPLADASYTTEAMGIDLELDSDSKEGQPEVTMQFVQLHNDLRGEGVPLAPNNKADDMDYMYGSEIDEDAMFADEGMWDDVNYEEDTEHPGEEVSKGKEIELELESIAGEIEIETKSKWPSQYPGKGDREVIIRNNRVSEATVANTKAINVAEANKQTLNMEATKELIGEGATRGQKIHQLKVKMGMEDTNGMRNSKNYTMETIASAVGRNLEINQSVDSLVEFYDLVQEGELTADMYFSYFLAKNGRTMVNDQSLNIQSDKQLHRFLILDAEAIVNREVSMDNLLNTQKAIAQAFGYGIDKLNDTGTVKFADTLMNMPIDEVQGLMDQLMKGAHKIKVDGLSAKVGMEFIAQMPVAIATIKAYQLAKANGDKTFESSLALETDGKTNGFALKTQLFPFPDEAKHREWSQKAGVLIGEEKIAEAVDGPTAMFEKIDDSYETLIKSDEMPKNMEEMIVKVKKAEAKARRSDKKKASTLQVSDYLSTLAAGKSNSIKPMIENGKVTDEGRNLAKQPFMKDNYGSGKTSLKRGVGVDMSNKFVDAALQGMNGGKKGPEYTIVMEMVGSRMTTEELQTALIHKGAQSVTVGVKTVDGGTMEMRLDRAVAAIYAESYGVAMSEVLDTELSHLHDINNVMNNSFKIMFRLYEKMYDAKVKEATTKGKGRLTVDAETKIIRELANVFPAIQGPLSKGRLDGIAIFDDGNAEGSDKAQTRVKNKGQKSFSVQTVRKKFKEAMSAGSVIPIHFLDGAIMAVMMKDKRFTNVFDALVMSPEDAAAYSVEYNRLFAKFTNEWDLLGAISDALAESIEAAGPKLLAEINKENFELGTGLTSGGGKQMKYWTGKKFEPISLVGYQDKVQEAAVENKKLVDKYRYEDRTTHQMVLGTDGGHTETGNGKLKKDILGSLKEVTETVALTKSIDELNKCKD